MSSTTKAVPKQQGLVIDTSVEALVSLPQSIAPLPVVKAPPKATARRRRPQEDDGRNMRPRMDKELTGDQMPVGDPKDDVVPVDTTMEPPVDARRSQEYRALPEEIRVRGDHFMRGLERGRMALISEKELLEMAQPFFSQHPDIFTQAAQTNLTYNKWTVVRQRIRRKIFILFRHNDVRDMSWLTEERALCLAARFFLRDAEVNPTEQEVKRLRTLLASYLDPEQQRQVTRVLKEASSPPLGPRTSLRGDEV